MRLARQLPIPLLVAALLVGCGSADSTTGAGEVTAATGPAGAAATSCPLSADGVEDLRVTGLGCRAGQQVASAWVRSTDCAPPGDGSRGGCRAGGYLCLATAAERGTSVSCGRPGRSLSFLAKSG